MNNHIYRGDIGSFEFNLIKISRPDINYNVCQKILVKVKQNNTVLYSRLIDNIDSVGITCKIDFEYDNLSDPIKLILENSMNDDQFNRDNPVEISNLTLDDLFNIKKFEQNMHLIQDNQIIDKGNVLYLTGILQLKINLPIIKSVVK
jgi:hypothetical protein